MPVPQHSIPPGEIHVWHRELSVTPAERDRYFEHLSPDERARAARFHFDVHREANIASRGWLRELLGAYTGSQPAAVEFLLGHNGKPYLPQLPLHFNLSHSGNHVACAIVLHSEVGLDVECPRSLIDLENLARRFFSPAESQKLLALPPAERPAAFFRCWTRKEAYIKATGQGLSAALDSFEVTFLAEESPAFVTIGGSPETAANWSMFDISDPSGAYAGAVAIPGVNWTLRLFEGGTH